MSNQKPETTVERDIDAAMETASNCRIAASQFRQMGPQFAASAQWHLANAKSAEKWAAKRSA